MKRPRIYERYRGNEFKKEPVTGYFVAAYSDYQASFLLDQLEWSTGDIGIIAKCANWHECTAEMKRRSQRKIYKWMLELE